MPKQKAKLDPAAQAEHFRRSAQDAINAGELDPIAGERALDALVRKAKKAGAADDGEPPPDTSAR